VVLERSAQQARWRGEEERESHLRTRARITARFLPFLSPLPPPFFFSTISMSGLAGSLGLVLTNAAILPALVYTFVRHLYIESAILLAVFVASSAFHICQVGWFCFGVTLSSLQLTDHFIVYTALVYFSLYLVQAPLEARAALTLGVQAFLLPVIAAYLTTTFANIFAVALVAAVALAALAFVLTLGGKVRFDPRSVMLAVMLLAGGVVLHVTGGDFGDDNHAYPAAHSVWHVLAMVSLYFVVDSPYGDTAFVRVWSRCLGRAQITIGKKDPVLPTTRSGVVGSGVFRRDPSPQRPRRHERQVRTHRSDKKRSRRGSRREFAEEMDVSDVVAMLYGGQ